MPVFLKSHVELARMAFMLAVCTREVKFAGLLTSTTLITLGSGLQRFAKRLTVARG